jgi:hypothetical protein
MTQRNDSADIAGLAATLAAQTNQLNRIEHAQSESVKKDDYIRDFQRVQQTMEQYAKEVVR